MSQEEKSVLITGASSGIGYYLAIEFAKRGYKVFAGARRIAMMESLKHYGITPIELDISSSESILNAKKIVTKETNGKLDILYNNAGISEPGAIFDLEREQIEKVFRVNVFGPLEIIKVFQNELLESKGTVAFTASIVKFCPMPFNYLYASTKTAFSYIPKVLSLETGKLGVKVVEITTGAIESEIWDSGIRKTPKSSIFYLEDEEMIRTIDSAKTPASLYSKKTVDSIEKSIRKGRPYSEYYIGEATTIAWIFGMFVPFWLYTKFILKALKLDKAFEKLSHKLNLRKQD